MRKENEKETVVLRAWDIHGVWIRYGNRGKRGRVNIVLFIVVFIFVISYLVGEY